MSVGEGAAGEVEEVAALAGGIWGLVVSDFEDLGEERGKGVPEWLGFIVVFYHAGILTFEIDCRGSVTFDMGFEIGGYFCAVGFGWVFTS